MGKPEQRESRAGIHFVQTYQNCPRSFFFKYILGWLPEKIGPALVLGAAYHEARENFWLGCSELACEELLQHTILSRANELGQNVSAEDLVSDGLAMLRVSFPLMQKDKERFRVIAVERELQPMLANGFRMTIRPDAIVEELETGDIYILEYKSTRSSVPGMLRAVQNGEQATAYVFGTRKEAELLGIDPARVLGVIPEIAYLKGSVCTATQGDPILPTQYQLDAFEAGMIGLLSEIGNKQDLLAQGVPAEVLFPRAPFLCTGFLSCDFEPICKSFRDGTALPFGFRKDSAVLAPTGLMQPGEILRLIEERKTQP